MLRDYYAMLPDLYEDNSCTVNGHCLTHLGMYVRLWEPLWSHSLFGFESYNGHITKMINSKYRLAEQLSFSIDVNQAMGCLAVKLVQTESQSTLDFIGPLCNLPTYRKKVTQIIPGIYCIGETHLRNFTEQEIITINKVTRKDATSIYTFSKLYFHDTIFHSCRKEERKGDSSNCCFISDGAKQFGMIQIFCFSPPLVLIK